MSGNSSSSNDSLPHPHISSVGSSLTSDMHCFIAGVGKLVYNIYNITFILLLLPLCIFILHHGFQQWMKKRSSAATMSHSVCLTYHLVTVELIGIIGWLLFCCNIYRHDVNILLAAGHLVTFTFYGETFFHLLTCVERYLAVVHPITYLSLRGERGVRLRNISVVCVWLICSVGTSLMSINNALTVLDFSLLLLSLIVIFFCSLSVLCVLIRPGPGKQGGGWARFDQSKKTAFYTIVVILGALVLRFTGNILFNVLLVGSRDCLAMAFGVWFNLPSSLVLPLLFIQREFRKRVFCKKNIQQGTDLQK